MHCDGNGGGEVGLVDGCGSAGASRAAECRSLIYTCVQNVYVYIHVLCTFYTRLSPPKVCNITTPSPPNRPVSFGEGRWRDLD